MLPKMVLSLVILTFLAATVPVRSSRILAIVPTPAYSHQIALRNIWIELSKRGHEVTLLTTDPLNDSELVNLTEIDLRGTYKVMDFFYKQITKASAVKGMQLLAESANKIFDYQLSQEPVKALVNHSRFDLVITESLFLEYKAFGDIHDCPKILISSFDIYSHIYQSLGSLCSPVASPEFTLPVVVGKMSFKERMLSFVVPPLLYSLKKFITFPLRHGMVKKNLGDNLEISEDIFGDVDLVLLNTNPLIHDIRPLGPNFIPFGGAVHIMPEKPLPKDLKDYLDSAKEGCIYFSLGTNSKSVYLGDEKIKIILDTLGELPYKVLWKFEFEGILTPPKNVKLISWAPQQDILRHPNVKLFIMQAGIQSIEESIINHVPMVMLPMYGDQEANAMRLENRGVARVVPHKPLPDKEEFKSIIIDVITNPKYKKTIKKMAELMMDQPMGGVEKAVWWIEYVLRHKGAKHLRNPAIDIPLYQYYCLDVLAAILLVLFSIIFVIYKIVTAVLRVIYKILANILRLVKNMVWRRRKVSEEKKKKRKKKQ